MNALHVEKIAASWVTAAEACQASAEPGEHIEHMKRTRTSQDEINRTVLSSRMIVRVTAACRSSRCCISHGLELGRGDAATWAQVQRVEAPQRLWTRAPVTPFAGTRKAPF